MPLFQSDSFKFVYIFSPMTKASVHHTTSCQWMSLLPLRCSDRSAAAAFKKCRVTKPVDPHKPPGEEPCQNTKNSIISRRLMLRALLTLPALLQGTRIFSAIFSENKSFHIVGNIEKVPCFKSITVLITASSKILF